MRQTFPKFIIYLLLPAFLVISAGNIFGFSWCFGDDGHVEIKYASVSGCCDAVLQSSEHTRPEFTIIQNSTDEECGSCLDFSAQKSDAAFSKRNKRVPTVSFKTAVPSELPHISAQSVKLVVGNLVPQPLPRVSQTILAHRTVVLLS